jgi:hypothetical protein
MQMKELVGRRNLRLLAKCPPALSSSATGEGDLFSGSHSFDVSHTRHEQPKVPKVPEKPG